MTLSLGRSLRQWRERHAVLGWLPPLVLTALAAWVVFILPLHRPETGIARQVVSLAGLGALALSWSLAGLTRHEVGLQARELSVGAALTLSSVLFVEGAARLLTFRQDNVLGQRAGIFHFEAEPFENPGPYGDLTPQEGVWTLLETRPYTLRVNQGGLRNDEEVDWGRPRILCVGDSFTLGPFVSNAETWPAQLEAELLRQGQRVQVLNAGVSGYTIAQEGAYLREKGLRLKPALVLLGFYVNDIGDLLQARQGAFARAKDRSDTLWRWFKRHSALMHVGRAWGLKRTLRLAGDDGVGTGLRTEAAPGSPEPSEEALRNAYSRLLHDVAKLLEREGVRFAIVAFPGYYQLWPACGASEQEFLSRLAEADGVPFLDLLPEFRPHRVEDLYLLRYDAARPLEAGSCFPEQSRYVGNKHLSRLGYRVTARAVARFLEERGLAPSRTTGASASAAR